MRNIAINDTVRIGPTGPELVVADVDTSTVLPTIYVWYDLTNNTSVAIRTRLYLVGKPARVYFDPYAKTAAPSSLPTDSNGRVGFYVADERFDYLISSSDFTTRGFTDAEGGWKGSDVGWVNAKDFPTIQDAVNAAAWGGVVYIPAGLYHERTTPSFTQTLVLPPDRPVRLVGDGPGVTTLRAAFAFDPSFDPNKDYIHLTGDNQSIEDLSLLGGQQSGTGVGIRITHPGTTDQVIYGTLIRNCRIHEMPGFGIFVGDATRIRPIPTPPSSSPSGACTRTSRSMEMGAVVALGRAA
ncbi:MAG: hypothetical protein HZC42_11220 [Candidatus Eisenbacteria bacterium]|nr:hypothetical protein [Candidatus Eisenbacteria bacterium]